MERYITKEFWIRKYNNLIPRIIGICYKYVNDKSVAEDIAHDTFLTCIEKSDSFKGTDKQFDAWLKKIAVNKTLLYLRDNRSCVLTDDYNIADNTEFEEDIDEGDIIGAIKKANFTKEELLEAVTMIPLKYRAVFNLYVFEDYSHKQIAEYLGTTVGNTKVMLLRARKLIQEILFKKSKQKKRSLMVIPLFAFSPSAKFDLFMKENLDGYAIKPSTPLTHDYITQNAPYIPEIKSSFYPYRIPFFAGMGAFVAGMIVFPVLHNAKNVQPQRPHSAETMVVPNDTVSHFQKDADSDETGLQYNKEIKKITTKPSVSNTENNPIELKSMPADTLESAKNPVVIKKVLKKSKKTVIITDTNNLLHYE